MTNRETLQILTIKFVILGMHLFVESSTIKPLTELARRGHQVTFFASALASWKPRSSKLTFEVVRVPRWVPFLALIYFELTAARRLLATIAKLDAVILDPFSVPFLFPILFLRRLCSSSPALLLHVESNVIYVGSPIRRVLLNFTDVLSIKLASITFDKIFYSTPMMGQLYRQLYGVAPEKLAVWPNAVESDFSRSAGAGRVGELRRQLGLVGRFGFLYHGALRTEGCIELVEAFSILRASSVNAMLILLGYGEDREVIARYIQHHNLDDTVRLCGPVAHTEIPTYIAACDAGIVPLFDNIRWRYQNPVKILELLAMGKPMIVSDIPAHRWIMGNTPVAFYLKGTDPASIAEGVQEFLALRSKLDPTLGQKIVLERFTPERVADVLEKEIISHQGKVL